LTDETILEDLTEDDTEIIEKTSGEEDEIDYLKDLKAIRNDVEQINELNQSLVRNCRDLAEEVIKILKLVRKTLVVEVSEKAEMAVDPNGYMLLKAGDSPVKPLPLAELPPELMGRVLKKLMPKLRESLKEQRQAKEELASDLARIRESLS